MLGFFDRRNKKDNTEMGDIDEFNNENTDDMLGDDDVYFDDDIYDEPDNSSGGMFDDGVYGDDDVYSDYTEMTDEVGIEDDAYHQTEQEEEVDRSEIHIDNKKMKVVIDSIAARGNTIAVTGCGGAGTSTIAENLANTLCNMGYSVLVVDLDTMQRAQSYVSLDNYRSMLQDEENLKLAINNNRMDMISLVRRNYSLLTIGMAADGYPVSKVIEQDKLAMFISNVKSNYNFVIYDTKYSDLINPLKSLIVNADNILMVIDSSNWGVLKTLNEICNTEDEKVLDILFGKSQIVFNKYRGFNRLMGKRTKIGRKTTEEMDSIVQDLTGMDIGYYFSDLDVIGIIKDDPEIEKYWCTKKRYSDTKVGREIFSKIIYNMMIRNR